MDGVMDKSSSRHKHKIKTIRLTDSQRKFLELRASRTGKPVNQQIRELIDREMSRSGSGPAA